MRVEKSDGALVCLASLANGPVTRARGLLGKRGLNDGEGILIEPCSSVHTMFMRFTIDVVYLDAANVICKSSRVPAYRLSWGGREAKRVLELPEGSIQRFGLVR